jgi:hypothetical protein
VQKSSAENKVSKEDIAIQLTENWMPNWFAAEGDVPITHRSQMNAINVIAPYKHHGRWVFDDPRVGLSQEPFVAGADTWIDCVVADIPNAEWGFTLIFSSAPFPGHQYRLDWQREEGGGNWYYSEDLDMEGWLCPALFKYFSNTPKTLYAQIKARN